MISLAREPPDKSNTPFTAFLRTTVVLLIEAMNTNVKTLIKTAKIRKLLIMTVNNDVFSIVTDYQEKEEFYRNLYLSFYKMPGSWVMKNYKVDHRRKMLCPKVPHYKEVLGVYREKNLFVAGCMYNLNSNGEMQFEKIGFTISTQEKAKCCEVLSFFILPVPKNKPFQLAASSIELNKSIMKKNELKYMYATAVWPTTKIYKLYRWEEVDSKNLNDDRVISLIRYTREEEL